MQMGPEIKSRDDTEIFAASESDRHCERSEAIQRVKVLNCFGLRPRNDKKSPTPASSLICTRRISCGTGAAARQKSWGANRRAVEVGLAQHHFLRRGWLEILLSLEPLLAGFLSLFTSKVVIAAAFPRNRILFQGLSRNSF
jgi:hypothetical protein